MIRLSFWTVLFIVTLGVIIGNFLTTIAEGLWLKKSLDL